MTPPLDALRSVLASPPPVPSPTFGPGIGAVPPPTGVGAALVDAAVWATQRPWLAAVAAGLLVVWVASWNMVEIWRHRHHAYGARLVTIAPPPEVDPRSAGALWANLAGVLTPSRRRRLLYGAPHVVWQYTWSGRQLLISIWVPGTVPAGAVEAAVRAAWPSSATTTDTNPPPPIPLQAHPATGGHLLPVFAEWLPFATDHDADPLRPLMSAGAQLTPDEYACVQILARPATPRRAARARRAAGRLRAGKTAVPAINPAAPLLWLIDAFLPGTGGGGRATAPAARRDPTVERDVRAILDKTAHPLWQTDIRYAVATTNRRPGADPIGRLRGIADTLASAFAIHTGRNRLTHRTRMPAPVAVLAARRLGPGFLTSTPELAALAALPQDLAVPGLDRARAASMPAPVAVPGGGRGVKMLGDAEIGGHSVGLSVPDARYHMHVIGSTGSGKTTLLVNMALDDIKAGRGTVVIDPHGDLVLDILDRLPATVADRVVLFDPDQPNPPTLNPLEGDDPDLVVDNLVSIFGTIFTKAWGPRMDDVMRVACLTLLRHNNVTLQHIPPLLNSPQFRSAMTVDLDDPAGLSGFWQWYDSLNDSLRSQVIGPVLARLRSFLLRDFVKRTMRYPKSSFDMGKVLDGGVLLVRIPKGVLGEDTSRLLGSLILAQVWQAATARAATASERRRDATLIIDEAQNFLTLANSLDTMLAEARKYRLSLVLAHQDLAQFPRDLLAAASANARNKVYFTVAPEDAKVLSRHTQPELGEHDLAHLDAYTAAARLVVDGRQTPAFTMRTRPPKPVVGEATAIRQVAAAAVPAQDTSAVDDLVERLSRKPDDRRNRPKGDRP
ncbi:type IV secretory system conjugative DNA transfer family protein [Micromonospora rifamycinica]|uniref:type IV secretory system conjugative DNA transfer family protein n=1 Tax=Micromonospora rifamycinica TaxID=291594 RepID=UPI003F540943